MKPRIYFLFLFALFLGLFSCNKQLNTTPQTAISQLSTFTEVSNALAGCYAGFQSINYTYCQAASGNPSGWSATPDLMGDDFIEDLASLGNWRFLSEMSYAADNGQVQGLFAGPYEVISRANNVLQSIPPFLTGDSATKAGQIQAQAYAIRAIAHFDVMRYFAQDFGFNSSNLGVPYVTSFNAQNPFANLPVRLTVAQDYDSIYTDIDRALTAYRNSGDLSSNTSRYYIDTLVIHAFKARVDLYASQWNDAIAEASIALDISSLGSATDFLNSFNSDYEATPPSEVIWQIPSDNFLQPALGTNGTNPNYAVSSAATQTIDSLGGAYTNASIIAFGQTLAMYTPYTLLQKYPGINSFKFFRAGEMLLIKAEAEAKSANPVAALKDLNALRTNRGVKTGTETGTALLAAIYTIRRIELLGEGHRWFDLKRTTRTIRRSDCGTTQGSASSNCSFDSTNRGWVMPIPLNDVIANPKLVQNPGY